MPGGARGTAVRVRRAEGRVPHLGGRAGHGRRRSGGDPERGRPETDLSKWPRIMMIHWTFRMVRHRHRLVSTPKIH